MQVAAILAIHAAEAAEMYDHQRKLVGYALPLEMAKWQHLDRIYDKTLKAAHDRFLILSWDRVASVANQMVKARRPMEAIDFRLYGRIVDEIGCLERR